MTDVVDPDGIWTPVQLGEYYGALVAYVDMTREELEVKEGWLELAIKRETGALAVTIQRRRAPRRLHV